jgi:hypothetical protein
VKDQQQKQQQRRQRHQRLHPQEGAQSSFAPSSRLRVRFNDDDEMNGMEYGDPGDQEHSSHPKFSPREEAKLKALRDEIAQLEQLEKITLTSKSKPEERTNTQCKNTSSGGTGRGAGRAINPQHLRQQNPKKTAAAQRSVRRSQAALAARQAAAESNARQARQSVRARQRGQHSMPSLARAKQNGYNKHDPNGGSRKNGPAVSQPIVTTHATGANRKNIAKLPRPSQFRSSPSYDTSLG